MPPRARRAMAALNRDWDTVLSMSRQMIEASPHWRYRKEQLVWWLGMAGRWQEIVDYTQTFLPVLFQEQPEVNAWNAWVSTTLAAAAFVAMVVEILPIPVDDNFRIPLIAGVVLEWLA